MKVKVELLFEDASLRIGAAGSLLVTVYRGQATVGILREVEKHQAALLHRFEMITTVAVIPNIAQMSGIDDAVKKQSFEMMRRFDGQLRGAATIILARGFGAAIVRTFMSGFTRMSKTRSPSKTFAEVLPALDWVGSLPEQDSNLGPEPSLVDSICAFAS